MLGFPKLGGQRRCDYPAVVFRIVHQWPSDNYVVQYLHKGAWMDAPTGCTDGLVKMHGETAECMYGIHKTRVHAQDWIYGRYGEKVIIETEPWDERTQRA